eukprot:8286141-Pyramimonas_sp.AAC.1
MKASRAQKWRTLQGSDDPLGLKTCAANQIGRGLPPDTSSQFTHKRSSVDDGFVIVLMMLSDE